MCINWSCSNLTLRSIWMVSIGQPLLKTPKRSLESLEPMTLSKFLQIRSKPPKFRTRWESRMWLITRKSRTMIRELQLETFLFGSVLTMRTHKLIKKMFTKRMLFGSILQEWKDLALILKIKNTKVCCCLRLKAWRKREIIISTLRPKLKKIRKMPYS